MSAATMDLVGVNLAGAEFGSVGQPYGQGYTYPTHAEIDYEASKGANVIRLPFLWERLQPTLNGLLDPAELARIDDVVNYASSKGIKVDLDPHDFGNYDGQAIGSAAVPNSAFADLWGKLASHYAGNSNVLFGLMNEPQQPSAAGWLQSVNAAIAAIRGAGAQQEVLVPGIGYDGAWTWTTDGNSSVIGTGVVDPSHNLAFEVHQYLDSDGSGTHANVVSADIGVQRLEAVTQWAESTGNRLFLGEFGVSSDATSLTAMSSMLAYMNQHTDAWQGATYWAAGPWWGNYMYSAEPSGGVDAPQMTVLERYMHDATPTSSTGVVTDNFEPTGSAGATSPSGSTAVTRSIVAADAVAATGATDATGTTDATDATDAPGAPGATGAVGMAASASATDLSGGPLGPTGASGATGAASTMSGPTGPTSTTIDSGGRFQGKHYSSVTDTAAPDGTLLVEVKNFDNSSHRVELFRPAQTLHSNHNDVYVVDPAAQGQNTFVFSHGFGVDTIRGFNVAGPGHDTLDLPASDFTSIADVLRHTQNISTGAVIHDLASGDVVRVIGVSKAALLHNQGDFKLG